MAPTAHYVLLSAVYCFINCLFVFKYSARITSHNEIATLLYAAALVLFMTALRSRMSERLFGRLPRYAFPAAAGLFTAVCAVLLLLVDPATINVARFAAINEWLGDLFAGRFPYGSDVLPSGFPVLFLLASPFYLLGDAGFLQIAGFLLFIWLVRRRFGSSPGRYVPFLLLVTSPVFLYEIVVRSELFTNMVIVFVCLEIIREKEPVNGLKSAFAAGVMAGLLLSTRGVALLLLAPYFVFLFKRRYAAAGAALLGAGLTFLLTLLPFYLWNPELFQRFGPLAVQGKYIPSWILALVLAVQAVCAYRAKSPADIFRNIAYSLIVVVAAAFFLEIMEEGFNFVIYGNGFDIAYFIFPLPFLLISHTE